jgi:hypothetical protein
VAPTVLTATSSAKGLTQQAVQRRGAGPSSATAGWASSAAPSTSDASSKAAAPATADLIDFGPGDSDPGPSKAKTDGRASRSKASGAPPPAVELVTLNPSGGRRATRTRCLRRCACKPAPAQLMHCTGSFAHGRSGRRSPVAVGPERSCRIHLLATACRVAHPADPFEILLAMTSRQPPPPAYAGGSRGGSGGGAPPPGAAPPHPLADLLGPSADDDSHVSFLWCDRPLLGGRAGCDSCDVRTGVTVGCCSSSGESQHVRCHTAHLRQTQTSTGPVR